MFCFFWSIGATTTATGRERFDKWVRDRLKKHNIEFPDEGKVYDWFWNTTEKKW